MERFNEALREGLFTGTRKAFCQTKFGLFNGNRQYYGYIQNPHDTVHVKIGGDMGSTRNSSFDPIFYLHHNYIDRQYAYYQALQDIRGTPIKYPDEEIP